MLWFTLTCTWLKQILNKNFSKIIAILISSKEFCTKYELTAVCWLCAYMLCSLINSNLKRSKRAINHHVCIVQREASKATQKLSDFIIFLIKFHFILEL